MLFIIVKGSVRVGQAFYEKFACLGAEELTSRSEEVYADDLVAIEDCDLASIER
jgi:hypothetical protein